jgi:hypothetical protein
MTHGGSCQSPKRLSAVELGPPKVSSTNVPNRSHEFYYRDSRYGPDFSLGSAVVFTPGLATACKILIEEDQSFYETGRHCQRYTHSHRQLQRQFTFHAGDQTMKHRYRRSAEED